MDGNRYQQVLNQVRTLRTKQGANSFEEAVAEANAQQLRHEAFKDVLNTGKWGLGAGLAAGGAVGLYNLIRRNLAKKRQRGAPPVLSLPYPVTPAEDPERVLGKQGGYFDKVTDKTNLPWYGAATLGAGLAGLIGGYKGMTTVQNRLAEQERKRKLEEAQREFQEALLMQYDKPVEALGNHKLAADTRALGQELDGLYDRFEAAQKTAEIHLPDLLGGALSSYGRYAGISSLLTGALVYNQMKKRQRRAILEKALLTRERNRFEKQPPEIVAIPSPIRHLPRETGQQKAEALGDVPEATPTSDLLG